ncbi:c-type cytochrome biogenesis protein CcsB, partial [Amycolatopsis magusensis]|nr:c-type cytochrome biogenesis protein CcsB [Amycolatopsis magusensis]
MVNETLSQFSDLSYTTAVAVYVLAMMFFLVEQSFGRKGRQAAQRTRERSAELVGAGGGSVLSSTVPPADEAPARRERAERIGSMG